MTLARTVILYLLPDRVRGWVERAADAAVLAVVGSAFCP